MANEQETILNLGYVIANGSVAEVSGAADALVAVHALLACCIWIANVGEIATITFGGADNTVSNETLIAGTFITSEIKIKNLKHL